MSNFFGSNNFLRRNLYSVPAALAVALHLGACSTAIQPNKMAMSYSVHKVYGDHMVLQREKPIRISGTAIPGESVLVSIGDANTFATANDRGEWVAVLPAMKAGGPYTVSVSGAATCSKVVFSDVLIGDIWLASGQSNMQLPVYDKGKSWCSMNGWEEAQKAQNSNIRLFNATSQKYVSPEKIQTEVKGPGWQLTTPETVAPFSAVAYYFGRRLQQDVNVPIGLISANWGGTRIEPWISRAAYAQAGRTNELANIDAILKNNAESEAQSQAAIKKAQQDFTAWEKRFYAVYAKETALAADWKNPGYNDFSWQKIAMPNNSFPDNVDGVGWYRKIVTVPAAWAGKKLTLSLGAIDDCDETFFNGVKVGAIGTDVDSYWAAKRVYQIPGKLVQPGCNVIAVRVSDMCGDGGLQGTAMEMFLSPDGKQKISLAENWKFKLEFSIDTEKIGSRPRLPCEMMSDPRDPNFPATLYNSMIAPWTGYPMRGFLWYQGESSVGAPEDYLKLQKLLISDWRGKWNDTQMPFIFVQLPGFERHTPDKRLPDDFWVKRQPGDPDWAIFREAQAATLKQVPYTGMAVCIDAGDHSDLHPANKQVVGFRLAREAERISYGKNIVSTGPYFKSMAIKGDKAILSFANVGKGLIAQGNRDGKLGCFAIAGKDGKFVWADAVIDGDTVVVSSPQVIVPAAVRYGWVSYAGNLNFYNQDGFPACPFRTDMPDYAK